MKPGVGKTRNRLLLGSVALSGGVAIVLVTHQDQAHAVWHSLTGVPVAALGLVLVLVLCQLSCQASSSSRYKRVSAAWTPGSEGTIASTGPMSARRDVRVVKRLPAPGMRSRWC